MEDAVCNGKRRVEGEDDEVPLVAQSDAAAREEAMMVTLEYAYVAQVTMVSPRGPLSLTYHAGLPRPVGVDYSFRWIRPRDTLV